MKLSFTIVGTPRTKNKGMPIRVKGKPVLLTSRPHRAWLRSAMSQVPAIRLAVAPARLPVRGPIEVTAVWYRASATGDEDNFEKALGDFLQKSGVIENDKFIHWSGDCRLDKDAARPRIEVTIEPITRSKETPMTHDGTPITLQDDPVLTIVRRADDPRVLVVQGPGTRREVLAVLENATAQMRASIAHDPLPQEGSPPR